MRGGLQLFLYKNYFKNFLLEMRAVYSIRVKVRKNTEDNSDWIPATNSDSHSAKSKIPRPDSAHFQCSESQVGVRGQGLSTVASRFN